MKRFTVIVCLCLLVIQSISAPIASAIEGEVAVLQPAPAQAVELSQSETVAIAPPPPSAAEPAPEVAPPASSPAVPQQLPSVAPSPAAVPVAPAAVPKPALFATIQANYGQSPLSISALSMNADGGLDYLDIYQANDSPFASVGTELVLTYTSATDEVECHVALPAGYLLGGSSLRLSRIVSEPTYASACLNQQIIGATTLRIELRTAAGIIQRVTLEAAARSHRLFWKSRPADGATVMADGTAVLAPTDILDHRGDILPSYEPYTEMPLKIVEVYVQPPICATSNPDPTCRMFVKVVNDSNQPVVLDKLRLRSGDPNTSSSYARYTKLTGVIEEHSYGIISASSHTLGELAIAREDGALWFEDAFVKGISYPSDVVYTGAELAANKYHSWALDESDGVWKWALPSPTSRERHIPQPGMGAAIATDDVDTRKPCRPDQFRNPETGRCKSLASTSVLKPCRADQYRSEDTGRCRSIASDVIASLKPCKDGQFRNAATGRCKKIASTDDIAAALKPCPPGKERNPATGRCRNIKKTVMPLAAHAVEPLRDTMKGFSGWWAISGIVIVAAGYGVWEWRREIGSAIRRVGQIFTHGGKV